MEVSGAESGLGLYLFEHDFPRKRLAFVARETGIHFSGSCSSVRYRYRLPRFGSKHPGCGSDSSGSERPALVRSTAVGRCRRRLGAASFATGAETSVVVIL